MAELVDATDLKSVSGDRVPVRFRPPAPAFARFASYGSASQLAAPSFQHHEVYEVAGGCGGGVGGAADQGVGGEEG